MCINLRIPRIQWICCIFKQIPTCPWMSWVNPVILSNHSGRRHGQMNNIPWVILISVTDWNKIRLLAIFVLYHGNPDIMNMGLEAYYVSVEMSSSTVYSGLYLTQISRVIPLKKLLGARPNAMDISRLVHWLCRIVVWVSPCPRSCFCSGHVP